MHKMCNRYDSSHDCTMMCLWMCSKQEVLSHKHIHTHMLFTTSYSSTQVDPMLALAHLFLLLNEWNKPVCARAHTHTTDYRV